MQNRDTDTNLPNLRSPGRATVLRGRRSIRDVNSDYLASLPDVSPLRGSRSERGNEVMPVSFPGAHATRLLTLGPYGAKNRLNARS